MKKLFSIILILVALLQIVLTSTFATTSVSFEMQNADMTPNRLFSVALSVATQGCKGTMQGTGTVKGHIMTITDQAGNCSLSLMHAGPNVQIDVDSCSGYIGASCDFSGTVTRH